MDFEYVFKYTEQNSLRMEVIPNEKIKGDLSILTDWLHSDVSIGTTELPKVKEVLESKGNKKAKIWGNAFIAKVNKKYTKIKWSVLKLPTYCKLPTEMLYEILQIWVKELKKDRENRNNVTNL